LYERLSKGDALTPAELAAACKIHPRYAREWLEQQAVAGVLTVDDASAPAERRRYTLPANHAAVVADARRPEHLAPLARMIVGIGGVIDQVVTAYRTGGGVPYARYGPDFRHGQGGINRPAFAGPLVRDWLPAMSTAAKLKGGARIVDLGCGQGFAAISVAAAFPGAEVWGIDGDPSSIEDARRFAAEAGVKVRFECADGAALATHGPFDVVMLLEVLHDLARPADVLKSARRALASDGAVLVADEKVAGQFTAPGDDLERMMYGWSISHCLPSQMVEQPSAAIGTVIRESLVRELADTADFRRVDVLDVDGGFFRLYELRP
jgi:2-polyprenyl-3-methyl-5-hydroxy-6-metoxy-1,4-benzoquinol methylase